MLCYQRPTLTTKNVCFQLYLAFEMLLLKGCIVFLLIPYSAFFVLSCIRLDWFVVSYIFIVDQTKKRKQYLGKGVEILGLTQVILFFMLVYKQIKIFSSQPTNCCHIKHWLQHMSVSEKDIYTSTSAPRDAVVTAIFMIQKYYLKIYLKKQNIMADNLSDWFLLLVLTVPSVPTYTQIKLSIYCPKSGSIIIQNSVVTESPG